MSYFNRWQLAKYSDDQPRDENGRWTSAGGSPTGPFGMSEVDRHIADFKSDRPLTGPETKPLTELAAESRFVPYSQMPFFKELNQMQGTPNPMGVTPKAYSEAQASSCTRTSPTM